MNTLMPSTLRWAAIGALALVLPLAATAQEAYTRGAAMLHAGPSREYPALVRLGPGQPLDVVGCTRGYGWCDVVLPDGLRGWVAASRLDHDHDGDTLPLASHGAAIGVPIIGFTLGNYWTHHYRDRPWYRESRWWGNRPPPPSVPGWQPPPPPVAGWQHRPAAPAWNAPPSRPGWGGPPPPPQWHGPPLQRPGWSGPPQRPEWSSRPPAAPSQPPPAMPQPSVPVLPQFQWPQSAPPPTMPAPAHPPHVRPPVPVFPIGNMPMQRPGHPLDPNEGPRN